VGDDGHAKWYGPGTWRRRAAIAFSGCALLLLVFHRPLLLTIGEHLARHYAAQNNLKLELRLEGTVFSNLTVRNLHAVSTGKSPVESADIELARFTYSLIGLMRHGVGDFLHTADVTNARVILDPAKAKLKRPPPPNEKVTLPTLFPESIRLNDVSLLIKDTPYDTIVEHLDLHLDPVQSRHFQVDRLQLPGGQNFSKVTGESSYAHRNLILREVNVEGDRIALISVDASQIQHKTLGVKLESDLGGGKVSLTGSLRELDPSINVDVHLSATHVAADTLNKYIGPDAKLGGQVAKLNLDATGLFNVPKTWTGELTAQFTGLRQEEIGADSCTLHIVARDGGATIPSAEIVQGENRFVVHGSARLPADTRDFGRSPANLDISAAAVDLARATVGMPEHLTGAAEMKGTIEIKDARINGKLFVTAGPVGFRDGNVEKLSATVEAVKTMPPRDTERPWFADLKTNVTTEIDHIRYREYAIDSVRGVASSNDDLLNLQELVVKRALNEIVLRGQYRVPAEIADATVQPARVDVSVKAPQLGDYWQKSSPNQVTGPLQMDGQIEWRKGLAEGQFSVSGRDLKIRDLIFHQFSAQGSVADSVLYLNDFTTALNERDFVNASGQIDLRGPHAYRGRIAANVADLATLKPLLRAVGNQNELSGSFAVDWDGAGEARTIQNHGKLKLALEKGRYGDLQSLQARVDATYSPEGLDIPIIFFASNKMDFQASAQAHGETFEISKIQLDQGQAKYASGYVALPFVWKNIGSASEIFPAGGKVLVNFQSENIDLKQLFADIGVKQAATGVVSVKIDAHGTLKKLEAQLDLQARNLRNEQVPNLEPASFDLNATARDNQLRITGKLQQSKIQPVELNASLPFDAARVLSEHGLPDGTPVTAKLRLPRSSVNFIRQFAPQIEQLDGDVGFDVDVNGTIGRPVFSGSADMAVNVARSSNVTLPALRGFKARLSFSGDKLTVEQFGGELSGGKFSVTGGVKFPKLTSADIDLQLKADSVLVARNDTLTARANADIRIVGPFTSASVTGKVEMTNSQFLKNLDLIPIGLPGRPAPQPPSARPEFSFPQPPLRDWKFDVALKTKDPFLIRGNLAHGGAVSDLHLIGTGLHPGLQGMVRLENVEATLPFSRLEIAYGFLYFDPADSLNPKMDLHGTSVIRDYTIHVYIYGTSLAPQALFTSEPPLPQEEVISLLATGTTREELTGNNNVLAGRAAMLLVQQLYRKIFKTGQGTQNSSVFDRLDVDVGQIDPRTGQQQATAHFKLNDQFVLVGDLDVGGGFRGMVKYLIRFH
jgi:autotransporter translocation and assembly factor TamB